MTREETTNRILVFFTLFLTSVYILWRIFFTLPAEYGLFALICGVILLVVEVMGLLESFVHFWQLTGRSEPVRPQADPEKYPHVDIFISTYNEPPELLYKTINGCLHMDYPDRSKVHIYLCDDGHRDSMGELCRKMGVTHLVRDTHEFAKAGNLNHALQLSKSPYIVTFDADMIPRHDFLMETIPYFLGEEKIGFLQTPQTFYNPDLFQYNLYSESRIPNEQDYFYRDVQVMRNKSNTVIYGGTNTVLSREALEEAGGFFTGVITEDFATGMKIQSKGYQCYAIDKSLACGMAPEDLRSLIKQRKRWARGCIQTGRKLHFIFMRGLSLSQKISYLTSITYWYNPIKRFAYILAPVMYAVFNVVVVKCTLLEILIFWLPMYMLNNYVLKRLSGNIRNTRWTGVYDTILAPSLFFPVILETFGITQKKFAVTRKDGNKGGGDRRYQFLCSLPIIIFLALSTIGMVECIYKTFLYGTFSFAVIIFWLGSNVFNLTMALFFMFGRTAYRKTERFRAEIPCEIYNGEIPLLSVVTHDISEGGLSFLLDEPEYIPYDRPLKTVLASERYTACFQGKISNVQQIGGRWKYGIRIEEIAEDQLRELDQIIYDREVTLPKCISGSVSMVDDLMINVSKRIVSNSMYNRKLPRIELDEMLIANDGEHVRLRDFNYEFLTIDCKADIETDQELTLWIGRGLYFQCRAAQRLSDGRTMCRVLNDKELAGNPEFKELLNTWMRRYQKQEQARGAAGRAVESARSQWVQLDDMDLLKAKNSGGARV